MKTIKCIKCGKNKKVVVKRDLNKLIDAVWHDLIELQSIMWEDDNIVGTAYIEAILQIANKLDF